MDGAEVVARVTLRTTTALKRALRRTTLCGTAVTVTLAPDSDPGAALGPRVWGCSILMGAGHHRRLWRIDLAKSKIVDSFAIFDTTPNINWSFS